MSAEPEKNPYRPGVGVRPSYLAGRASAIGRFEAMLRAAPEQQAGMRMTGLRGVGKTVLLDEFEARAVQAGWVTAKLELQPRHNTDASILRVLADLLDRTRKKHSRVSRMKAGAERLISGKVALAWDEFSLEISPGSKQEATLTEDLFETAKSAVRQGNQGLVLLLDEAQLIRDEKQRGSEHPLSLLVAPIVALQREEVPLSVVLCGLPTLVANLQQARSYSERLWRGERIESLPHDEARDALVRPLEGTSRSIDDAVADAVVEEVEGYPYFIQVWGSELWDAADLVGAETFTEELLESVRPTIYERLDQDFYEPRIAVLTPAEQELLLVSAQCPYPPLRSADLGDASPKSSGNVNVLMGRLVEAGALYRIRQGIYEYTAPKFREFLHRRADEAG